MSVLELFSDRTREWFEQAVRGADTRTGAGLACDRLGRAHADPGADRLGEDAGRVPVRDRPADRGSGRGTAPALRLAAEGAELRRRAEPARAARRAPVGADVAVRTGDTPAEGARGDAAQAAGHPDHDAGVALPAAHLAGARDAAQRRDADPRRGTCRCRHEAWRSPRTLGRAPRPAHRRAVSSGSAFPPRSARSRRSAGSSEVEASPAKPATPTQKPRAPPAPGGVPGRSGSSTPARGRSSTSRSSCRSRTCASRAPARPPTRCSARAAEGTTSDVDLAVDLPRAPAPRRGAPLDDRLRQQPAARRTARAASERAGGASEIARAHHGSLAREQRVEIEELLKLGEIPCLVATSSLELGIDMGAVDLVDPGRVAEVGRARAPAHRPRRATSSAPSRRGASSRSSGPTCSSRRSSPSGCWPARSRRPRSRATRSTCSRSRSSRSAPTRRSRSASCTTSSAAPIRSPTSRAIQLENVLDMLSGRYPSDEFAELKPRIVWDRTGGTDPRARRRAAARGHERGHDPRPRPLRRPPRRRRRAGR